MSTICSAFRNHRIRAALPALLLLTACTPADVRYCEGSQRLQPGTPAFADCMSWAQGAMQDYDRDLLLCGEQARSVYPEYLEDRHRRATGTIIDDRGRARTVRLDVEPDYTKNAALNDLRRRITVPCMRNRGWNNPESWEYGRSRR